MSDLLFEIWRDDAAGEQEMGPVTEQGDKLRRATNANAAKAHSFKAGSDFQAFQMNYGWNGWGRWKPEPEWEEHFYTEAEAEEQRRYLDRRNVR
jgi:hypothetical protein